MESFDENIFLIFIFWTSPLLSYPENQIPMKIKYSPSLIRISLKNVNHTDNGSLRKISVRLKHKSFCQTLSLKSQHLFTMSELRSLFIQLIRITSIFLILFLMQGYNWVFFSNDYNKNSLWNMYELSRRTNFFFFYMLRVLYILWNERIVVLLREKSETQNEKKIIKWNISCDLLVL